MICQHYGTAFSSAKTYNFHVREHKGLNKIIKCKDCPFEDEKMRMPHWSFQVEHPFLTFRLYPRISDELKHSRTSKIPSVGQPEFF